MAEDVKQLLLQVDASIELLRSNLSKADAAVKGSTDKWGKDADKADASFAKVGRGFGGLQSRLREVNKLTRDYGGASTFAAAKARAMQDQMTRSADGIKAAFLASGAAIAGAFSAKALQGYADGYTRIQNSLKVAGLEGANLANVQQRLLDLSSKYGVSLASLTSLFGNATQAGGELGANQSQMLALTEATSQSLLITGTSATEASGAILGLTQALAAGTVRAEEFNQINEGGLRPLLQAAANSEKFGGSIAKLRAAVLDGKVSSQEFFGAILAGSASLEGQASKATLTLAGGFEALSSRLTVYFGEADKAHGVSAALGAAMTTLAENLDTVIPALTAIAVGLGTRYVLAAGQAAIASAGLAGALGAIVGNPIILGIAALAAGIAYLALRSDGAEAATRKLTAGQQALQTVMQSDAAARAAKDSDALANARANLTRETLRAAQAEAVLAAQQARKALNLASRGVREETSTSYTTAPGSRRRVPVTTVREVPLADRRARGGDGTTELSRAKANADRQAREAAGQMNAVASAMRDYAKGIGAAKLPSVAPTPAAGAKKAGSGGGSGKSQADIDAQFNDALRSEAQRTLSARRQLATSIEEQAQFEREVLDLAVSSARDRILSDKDMSQAQKNALAAQLQETAGYERQSIDRGAREALRQQSLDAEIAALRSAQDITRGDAALSDTRADRLAAEMRLVDLAYEQERLEQDAIIASETATAAQKAIAQQRLTTLRTLQSQAEEGVRRDNEGPLAKRMREIRAQTSDWNTAIEETQVRALDNLTNSLVDAGTEYVKLGGIAGDVINGIIRDLIRLAAQQAIMGAIGGGGGGLAGLFGGSFNVAKSASALKSSSFSQLSAGIGKWRPFQGGGYTGNMPEDEIAGVVHGREFVFDAASTNRIGVEQLEAIRSGQFNTSSMASRAVSDVRDGLAAGGTSTIRLELSGDIEATMSQIAAGVSVEVVRANAPATIAAARDATIGELSRARI